MVVVLIREPDRCIQVSKAGNPLSSDQVPKARAPGDGATFKYPVLFLVREEEARHVR